MKSRVIDQVVKKINDYAVLTGNYPKEVELTKERYVQLSKETDNPDKILGVPIKIKEDQ